MFEPARRTRHLILALAMIAVGACSLDPPASLDPAASPDASAAAIGSPTTSVPSPTAASTVDPTSSPTAARPEPSSHHDPSLEALLPTRAGDVAFILASSTGAPVDLGAEICPLLCPREAQAMAEYLGATIEEVTVAVAYDPDERYALLAWRIAGVDGARLREAQLAVFEPDPPFPIAEDVPVGDETVTAVLPDVMVGATRYLVVRDDALIVIYKMPPEPIPDDIDLYVPDDIAEIVAALP